MSKQLYEEALADVKKLKEIAEDNAKRAILEAVTPRIKDLIENQLLGEAAKSNDSEEDELLLDDMPEVVPADADPIDAAISMPDDEGKITLDLSMLASPEDEDYALSMDDEQAVDALVPSNKINVVKAESALRKLENKIHNFSKASAVLRETKSYLVGLVSTISEVEDMYSTLKNSNDSSNTQNLIQRLKECHKTLKTLMEQETNMKKKFSLNEEDVTLTLKGLPDDLNLDDVEIELVSGGAEEEEGEEPEEEGEEAEGEDVFGDEGEDEEDTEETEEGEESSEEKEEEKMETRWLKGDVVVEIDENMLRKEISRMRALREEAVPSADGHGPGDLGDLEDEDLGDPLEMDLSEADGDLDEEYDMDQGMDMDADVDMDEAGKSDEEGDLDEEYDMDQGMDMDMDETDKQDKKDKEGDLDLDEVSEEKDEEKDEKKMKESIKRRLASEIRIQTEAKKKAGQAAQAAKKQQKEAQQKKKDAQQKMKEAQQQAKQKKMKEAQQKKKDAEQKMKEAQQKQKKAKQMKEAYDYYATQFNESVLRTRKLQGMLAEATARNGSSKNGGTTRLAENTVELRDKLAEMNLFNAKLLFTNKLLQNESLTKRQKAEVIERLDEAQNVREAKLVYESLVKALQGGSTGRAMTESASRGVIGSSSRPARPAATTTTLNEGFEAERWAKLAGIIK